MLYFIFLIPCMHSRLTNPITDGIATPFLHSINLFLFLPSLTSVLPPCLSHSVCVCFCSASCLPLALSFFSTPCPLLFFLFLSSFPYFHPYNLGWLCCCEVLMTPWCLVKLGLPRSPIPLWWVAELLTVAANNHLKGLRLINGNFQGWSTATSQDGKA